MKFLTALILISSINAQAQVGFKNGNDITAVQSQGELLVRCNDINNSGPTSALFSCRDEILVTGDYDSFKGPEGVIADQVTLTAIHEDGSFREKTVHYNYQTNETTKEINLWRYTLLQRPLLNLGVNRISYKFTLNGKFVSDGSFISTVTDGGKRICPRRGFYWSNDGADCSPSGTMCYRFLRENNYCL